MMVSSRGQAEHSDNDSDAAQLQALIDEEEQAHSRVIR